MPSDGSERYAPIRWATPRTSPSPPDMVEHSRADVASNESVDDERQRGKARNGATPFESCDIGNDNLRQQLETGISTEDGFLVKQTGKSTAGRTQRRG